MKRSSKAKQQPELIVLSDDDSTVGAPVKKKVVRKEGKQPPVPSQQLLDIRQEMVELKNTVLKSAPSQEVLELCRRVAESENEFTSFLMDEILELRQENAELENTVKMMKHKKGKRMKSLESHLEKARLDTLEKSKLVNELQKSLAERERSEEVKKARRNEAKMKKKLIIDELTRKLAEFDVAKPNLLQLVEKHIPERIHDPRAINLDPASSDLFLPYKPGMQGTISLRHAKNELLPLYDDDMKAYLQKSDFVDDQRLICALCHATLKGYHILIHFFTKAHAKKVQGSGASVSAAAVSYWQQQMEGARPLMVEAMKERIRAAAGADA